jgi:hypothetical protein
MGLRRYPGATPFSRRQANIFYGRDKDIDKLLTLIQVEKKVLLYSKSGLGKTSLLEAGVLPKLPKNYSKISIRLFAYKPEAETPPEAKNAALKSEKAALKSETPLERVVNALKTVVNDLDTRNDTIIDQIVGNNQNDKTLWYYFKKIQIIENQQEGEAREKIFTLVFDQFEELFSYPKKDIEDFKTQLYELTELKLPDRIAALIAEGRQTDKELFNRENLGILHKKIEIKTVFAIRSDRLSLLNKLSDKLPDIQNTFYELLPLTYEQAQQAIENPARDNDPGFDTPPFTFHQKAIDKIIYELSDGKKENIETTQLQIVCHRIEEIVAAKTADGPRQIEVEDLPEFKNIFLNFYYDSLNLLQEENRGNAKRLIEDELITNNQRISLDEEICKKRLDNQELMVLVNTHLLRSEQNTFGRFSYEISHDTLVEPILESKKKYLDEQEKIELENKQKEELRKLREQQEEEAREREEELRLIRIEQERKEKERLREIKLQRKIFLAGTIVLVFLSAFLIYALRQKSLADERKIIAEENFKNFVLSEFDRNFKGGETFKNKEYPDYEEALKRYQVARTMFDKLNKYELKVDNRIIDTLHVNLLIDTCKNNIPKKNKHEALMRQFENSEKRREYLEAMNFLNDALDLGYDNTNVQKKKDELLKQAMKVYKKDIEDFGEMGDETMRDETTIKKNIFEKAYNYKKTVK